MDLKPDSLVVIPARAKQFGEYYTIAFNGETWTVADCTKCLGRMISGTGEDLSERRALAASWRRLFWKNCKILCNRMAPLHSRMRFWKQLLWGVSDYRLAMLRPIKTNIAALETEANKFTAYIVGARPSATESKETFMRRKNREISSAKSEVNLDIPRRHCWKLCSWMEHIHRHPEQPCLDALLCQNAEWLQERRIEYGGRRTQSRTHPGPPIRWDNGWIQVITEQIDHWGNAEKVKAETSLKANLLYDHVYV